MPARPSCVNARTPRMRADIAIKALGLDGCANTLVVGGCWLPAPRQRMLAPVHVHSAT